MDSGTMEQIRRTANTISRELFGMVQVARAAGLSEDQINAQIERFYALAAEKMRGTFTSQVTKAIVREVRAAVAAELAAQGKKAQ